MTIGDRHSVAEQREQITDPDELARREAENGVRQFKLAHDIVRTHVKDKERPFALRPSIILKLHEAALRGIHPLAGTFRNTPVSIGGSKHVPPDAFMVSEQVAELCDYVNSQWTARSANHLGAFVLWRLNWIHPFSDGNGRTARAVLYVVMSIKLDSILPGTPTIPDQIAANKQPYYKALEAADAALTATGRVDVSELEAMLDRMLAHQLVNAAKQAGGAAN